MKKDDLRNGMVVKTKNNNFYLVFRGELYNPISMTKHFITLSDYDDNLKRYFASHEFDIIKVYANSEIMYNQIEPIWIGNMIDWSTVKIGTKVRAKDIGGEWVEGTFVQYKGTDKVNVKYPFDIIVNEPNDYGYRDIMAYQICELID